MKSRWCMFRAPALKTGAKEADSPPEAHLVSPSVVVACGARNLAALDMGAPSGGRVLACVRCLELSECAE